MHRSTRLCLLLLALALPGLATAAAITLSDNLNQAEGSQMSISERGWFAQGFSTTGAAFRLTDVALLLRRDADAGGTFLVSIFNNSGTDGRPGAKVAEVATVAASSIGITYATYDIPDLSITLKPATSYFLVVSGVGLTGAVRWAFSESTSGTGFPSPRSGTVDAGVSWNANYMGMPQKMRIRADDGGAVVVPSPAP